MYVLKESLMPEEFCNKNHISKLTHQFSYNKEIDSMVIISTFNYNFFDYGGPSIASKAEGFYSGHSSVIFSIAKETATVDLNSYNTFTENYDFISILEEVNDYYDLVLHISDSANQYIKAEYLKPIQIKLNMLNKEDYKLFSALNDYVSTLDSKTMSAGVRSIINFGFTVLKYGIRMTPTNKVYRVKEVTFEK